MRKYPDMEDRTILWEIEDPFYGTIKTYRSCADEIFQNLKVFAARLGLTELGIYPTSGGK
jgi:protein-tyrosine-phosphatase